MQLTSKADLWRFHLGNALVIAMKLLVLCIAWLIFFYLIIIGWDLHQQEDLPQKSRPYEQLPVR
jgi:D-alanyl-lipoteichoic acid acyltransferase DltB (MBOAT superfamily)